jgi:hypothetical protein
VPVGEGLAPSAIAGLLGEGDVLAGAGDAPAGAGLALAP